MNQRRVTIYDIARKTGVSHTTVALALRNHFRISEARRKQIQKVAAEMGYTPDPLLASLAAYRAQIHPSREQGVIAWINHWEQPERLRGAHQEFDAYWRGAQTSAKRFGYKLEEICWRAEYSAKRFEQILLARGIRGVLIPPHHVVPDWGNFNWSKFSIIRFGLSVPSPDSHLVTSDQHRAVIMALKRMSDYGYRRIGMTVSDQLDQNIGGNYTGGFYAAQKLFKVPGIHALLKTDEDVFRRRPAAMKRLLKNWLKKTGPDAVLTADGLVPGFIRELGYRIPKDIAVAGTSVDVPVDVGIDQHSEAIGRIAVESLVAQINLNERGEPADPSRILVESRWRDGASLPRLRRS